MNKIFALMFIASLLCNAKLYSQCPTPTVTGPTAICSNYLVTYVTEPGMTSYSWTVSSLGIIQSGAGTNTIQVAWQPGFTAGQSVRVAYTCGGTLVQSPATAITSTLTAGTVTGNINPPACGQTPYSVPAGQSSYFWQVGNGTIVSGNGTNSVSVSWLSNPGGGVIGCSYISSTTGCMVLAFAQVTFGNPTPSLTGPAQTCLNTPGNIYTTDTGKSNYAWVISGGTINSGQGTNSVSVTWTTSSGGISVNYTDPSGCLLLPHYKASGVIAPPNIFGTTVICPNAVVAYTTDLNKSSYIWDVSGGTITSGAGTYSITVTWNGTPQHVAVTYTTNGCTTTTTKPVIYIPTTGTITGDANICQSLTGTYTADAGSVGYQWTVPLVGTILSGWGTNTITVKWLAGAGQQYVNVSFPNCGGTTVATLPVMVNGGTVGPETISGNPRVCLWATTSFSAPAGSNYVWSVRNGDLLSGQGTSTITVQWNYLPPASISLTYAPLGSCVSSATLPITIIYPTTTLTGNAVACYGSNGIYTTEAGMNNYSWGVYGGTITSGLGTNTINVNWTSPGNDEVAVGYKTPEGCYSTGAQTNVLVDSYNYPTITGASYGCIGSTNNSYSTESGMTGYIWTIGGGTITGGQGTNAISVTWNTLGNQSLSVNYTSPNGCTPPSATLKYVSIVALPVPKIYGNTVVCPQSTISFFTETGATNYVWSVAGGTITSGAGTSYITVVMNVPGLQNISVSYVNAYGCSPAAPTNYPVTVNPIVHPTITGPSTVCGITSATYFTEVGQYIYNWSVVGGTIASGLYTNTITINWTSTGNQSVSVTYSDLNGCSPPSPTNYPVYVDPLPVPAINGPSVVCSNSINTFSTDAGKTAYAWSVSSGNINSGLGTNSIVVAAFQNNMQISSTYFDSYGCHGTNTKTITVNPVVAPVISGPTSGCIGSVSTYSTQSGKSGYTWSISGGVIAYGQGASSVGVNWAINGQGFVTVSYADPITACVGTSAPFSVISSPPPTVVVTGPSPACTGINSIYSTNTLATNYVWSVSTGGTIASGQGTSSVNVIWSTTGAKTVSVTYLSGCTGTGTLNVTASTTCNVALSFNGTSNFVNIPEPNGTGGRMNLGTGSFVLEVYMKATTNNMLQTLLSKRTFASGSSADGYLFGIWNDGRPFLQIAGAPNILPPAGAANVFNGSCHWIAVRRSGTAVSFFVDGGFIGNGSPATSSNNMSSTGPLHFGTDPPTITAFGGYISEVRIWNITLSNTQIASNINVLLPQQTGLVGYYTMSNASGQTLTDLSTASSQYNGVLGAATVIDPADPTWLTNAIANCSINGGRSGMPASNYEYIADTSSLRKTTHVLDERSGVKIFPNPSSDVFNLQVETPAESYRIKVYDVMGKEILNMSGLSSEEKYLIGNGWAPGMYLLMIEDERTKKAYKILKN